MIFHTLLAAACLLPAVRAKPQVQVHGLLPVGQASTSAAAPISTADVYQGSRAYDNTLLTAPPFADNIKLAPFLQLQTTDATVQGISIPQRSTFLGFSIEMSVLTALMGPSSGFIKVPLLNLLANIEKRAGHVRIRVGGNTQEIAAWRSELPDGVSMAKEKRVGATVTTETPAVLYTDEMFNMMASISSMVHVQWYCGIPFNQTGANGGFRLEMMERGEAILGDAIIGFQAGNEPDLYVSTSKHRADPYAPADYVGEFGDLIETLKTNDKIPRKNILLGPSIAKSDNGWIEIMESSFLPTHVDSLSVITVEHYPADNCKAQFDPDPATWTKPQDMIASYLSHKAVVDLVSPYTQFANAATAAGKPFMMFETNTASCGGFAGISNTFVSALWTLNYAFQMASSNFTGAMLHVGGQSTYYNPFTPPPTNETSFHKWTVGPIFYSVLAVAEAFGSSNTSRIVPMTEVDTSPAYAIYENGVPARLALINYLEDATGAHNVNFTFAIGGTDIQQDNKTPASVKVKYMSADSIMTRDDIKWAGQTFGKKFESDGIMTGDLDIVEVPCNQADNTCTIPLKAPQFALVFLNDEALKESNDGVTASTFATTARTEQKNTATVDPTVLATSNGQSGKDRASLSGTSKTESAAVSLKMWDVVPVLCAMVAGSALVLRSRQ